MKKKLLGFDTEKYLAAQEKAIREKLNGCKKLYLEFGGKLLFDGHAARVLPGYNPYAKLILLQRLKKDLEILVCVSAKELQKGKFHGDAQLDYKEFTLRILGELKARRLPVTAVIINRFEQEPAALEFEKRLSRLGVKTYKRKEISGYPADTDLIVSKKGYGVDTFVKTTKSLVVVTAPSPNSGKMSTCLGQLYHEYRQGNQASYAKFESFPVWNLPLKHPVNVAYEAATADLGDFNLIDPFHLETYGKTAVNYNRDVEAFPILDKILKKITRQNVYKSPTEMGMNHISQGIIDDQIVQEAAQQEIIFRFFRCQTETVKGLKNNEELERLMVLMKELGLKPEDRPVVPAARKALKEAKKQKNKGEKKAFCGAAIQLPNGKVVTGKRSTLLHAESAVMINAAKNLAGIPDKIRLLPRHIIADIKRVKREVLEEKSESLNVSETLIALSVASATNPTAKRALKYLGQLRGCHLHSTHIPSNGDDRAFRKLDIWATTDNNVTSNIFFY